MKPAALMRLALAVFLLFGVVGPLSILMESKIHVVAWRFITVETIASGGLAASVILFGRRKWWLTTLIVFFWLGVMSLNSGGINFVVDNGHLRVALGGSVGARDSVGIGQGTTSPLTVKSEDLDAIYAQRAALGAIAIILLAAGYGLFMNVIAKELRQKARLETEVSIAQNIQQTLLPAETLRAEWCLVGGLTIPASEVGGDYFDIVPCGSDEIAVAIADVAGHGVGAGIVSAMTKSALRSQLQHERRPVDVLSNLNKTIFETSDEKTFVTFAYVLLNKSTARLALATAGHPPILVKNESSRVVTRHRCANVALGLKETVPFGQEEKGLASGDSILLYTDGILECTNADGEEFGQERLETAFSAAAGSPDDVCAQLVREARAFSGEQSFQDDVSIVCIKTL